MSWHKIHEARMKLSEADFLNQVRRIVRDYFLTPPEDRGSRWGSQHSIARDWKEIWMTGCQLGWRASMEEIYHEIKAEMHAERDRKKAEREAAKQRATGM